MFDKRWNERMIKDVAASAQMWFSSYFGLQGEFDYSRDALQEVERFLEEAVRPNPVEKMGRTIHAFSAFLGECMVRAHGASWKLDNGEWCVERDGIQAFPFTKVLKQHQHGRESDSIVSLFDAFPMMLKMEQFRR